jgi:DUF4097 and DUF4098 domain-containing protein YvlB
VIHQTFTVEGAPDIEVRIESGRVEIRDGKPGVVDVSVDTKTPGFIVEQRGNSILVSSDKNASWVSRGSAYVVVETPPGSDLRVAVASAPVTADLALGKVEIKSASGDIELHEVESLTVKTASGDIDVDSVDRSLRVTTASGDLRVSRHAGGSVVVSTASGDVHIEHSDATIEMNTASGDAYITHFEGRSANFKTMSGDVDLGIPPRTDVALDVTLLSGKLRVPDAQRRQEEPLRHMSIKAKAVSGDFTVTRV